MENEAGRRATDQVPNGDSKLRKLLFNEVSFIGMVIAVTISVSGYLNAPGVKNGVDINEVKTNIALIQQSIDNINKNHEAHIQDILQEQKSQAAAIIDNQKSIIELQKQVLILQQKVR